ncbi:unnamed protein product [Chondrus crispus]|uniref:Uncharacterized protein n=1 Tax=Chondrus crispus TaxID=2769 RepID=R7Q3G7_CHOCR|nr:unnamed protein product [Chondrus crispus]CDF32554.1 unnamed protein product [Chondrus crispus]|eukprot:XP_005712219.1 unnamed protein product [Chondrus crispus]
MVRRSNLHYTTVDPGSVVPQPDRQYCTRCRSCHEYPAYLSAHPRVY